MLQTLHSTSRLCVVLHMYIQLCKLSTENKEIIIIISDQCWVWLQNGDLKRETESLIVAAQNHSIRTNLVKAKIDKRSTREGMITREK